MSVFIALAVGIVLGVTLVSGGANDLLASQAAQDRNQVKIYRDQLYQQQALTDYRDRYAEQIRKTVTEDMLTGTNVALVSMPGAPSSTVQAIRTAVNDAGGVISSTSVVSANAFDATRDKTTLEAIDPFRSRFDPQAAVSTKVGTLLGQALLAPDSSTTDAIDRRIRTALTGASLVQITADQPSQAQLMIIVTAEATDPPQALAVLVQHVEFDVAMQKAGLGAVLAGPNSAGVDGTDVAQARQQPTSRGTISTVDVADLPSGVTTVVMAGRQRVRGSAGDYGAASSSDAPAPQLPIS